MRANRATYPIATMCRVLGVSTSGYYAWLKRPPSKRTIENAWLIHRIHNIHERSWGTYGAPRVHAELRDEGETAGLKGVSRRRGTVTTLQSDDSRPVPDLVDRDFAVTAPDRLWVADITCHGTRSFRR